ncbi:MAG: diguanylate cyclase [Propionivibrio sp.]
MVHYHAAIHGMLEAAPVCGTIWNHKGRGVDCNDAALRFFGLTDKQDWLDNYTELSPERQSGGEASGPLLLAHLHKAFTEGQAEFSWQHCRLDGRLLPARITMTRVRQGGGEWVVAYAVEQPGTVSTDGRGDMGDARSRLMLDNAPLGASVWNARGELIDCNRTTLRWLGLDGGQEFQVRVAEAFQQLQPSGASSADTLRQAMDQALQAGSVTIPWAQKIHDGSLMTCQLTVVRVVQDGEPMLAVFVRDLDEETTLQAQMRAANKRARIMLDATPLACAFWNISGEIVDCNLEAVRLFELGSKEEFVARFAELVPEFQPCGGRSVDLARQYVAQALQTGRMTVPVPWMRTTVAGEQVPCELTLVPVTHEQETMVVAFLRDLRQEWRLQAEKREAEERQRIMFDATPSCTTLWTWDDGLSLVDCNHEAASLFELSSKQEYLEHFVELSPEYQPSGRLSREMALEYVATAFREGSSRFEWMHQKLDGEPVPAEVTLVRVQRGESYVVVGNTRDLREEWRLQRDKREADERMQIMVNSTPLGCTFWDEEFRLVNCNQAAVKLFGFASKQEFMRRYVELYPKYQPDGQLTAEFRLQYLRKALREGHARVELTYRTIGGEMLPAELTLVRVQRTQGNVIAVYVRDLREHLEGLRRIHEANEHTRLMLDATPLCCNLWDEAHGNIACNQEAVNLFELESKQVYLDRFFELSPEYQPCGRPSSELAQEHISTAFREGRTRFEWMHQKLNGEPVPAEITLVRVPRGDGYIVAGYTRDLRELKESVVGLKRLEKLAYTDKLTGVANRLHFLEHANAALDHLSPGGSSSLLILDIDHFKNVNDTYGHTGGDVILQGVAERVRNILRPEDLFARYGGEEFVVLLTRAKPGVALHLAERVRKTVAHRPFEYQGHSIRVTISIGVSSCGCPAMPLQDLIDQADAALYQAKHLGRNRVEHHPPIEGHLSLVS